ncbi:MAG: prenyltransferase/squalene oxidase repeat-containing protein, partial [Planctomycetota bacterium]
EEMYNNSVKKPLVIILILCLIILTLLGVRYRIPFRWLKSKSLPPVSGLTFQAQVEHSIEKGLQWLYSKQSPDGGWRSETYGLTKSGQSMTPFTLYAMTQITNPKSRYPIDKGIKFLLDQINPDGSVGTRGIQDYPTYSTALSVIVLSRLRANNWQEQVKPMVRYLKNQQLVDELGWNTADPEYGGWGNGGWITKPSEPMPEIFKQLVVDRVDLSHTVFVLEALNSAGLARDDESLKKALVFVEKCQNYPDVHRGDGGFIFAPNSILGNKAGPSGKDEKGMEYYRSYGSMTADGVRALLFCWLDAEHQRIQAGIKWLMDNFRADQCPGFTNDPQPPWSQGVVFYYYWSFSRLLDDKILPSSRHSIAKEIAAKLIQLQAGDGSWKNPIALMKEDDPLISTNLAMMTLDYCRRCLNNED